MSSLFQRSRVLIKNTYSQKKTVTSRYYQWSQGTLRWFTRNFKNLSLAVWLHLSRRTSIWLYCIKNTVPLSAHVCYCPFVTGVKINIGDSDYQSAGSSECAMQTTTSNYLPIFNLSGNVYVHLLLILRNVTSANNIFTG